MKEFKCSPEYRRRQMLANRKRRAERKAAGLCTNCGGKKPSDAKMCRRCADQYRDTVRRFKSRERKKLPKALILARIMLHQECIENLRQAL